MSMRRLDARFCSRGNTSWPPRDAYSRMTEAAGRIRFEPREEIAMRQHNHLGNRDVSNLRELSTLEVDAVSGGVFGVIVAAWETAAGNANAAHEPRPIAMPYPNV